MIAEVSNHLLQATSKRPRLRSDVHQFSLVRTVKNLPSTEEYNSHYSQHEI
jgi:hypothetical protein